MTRISALFRYDCIDYTYFNICMCIKAFSFLGDQFHIVDIPLLVISPVLAEYILQSIEKIHKI